MSGSEHAALLAALPYARRFARALAGTQEAGDAMVASPPSRPIGTPDR
jgi:hypothetical protein